MLASLLAILVSFAVAVGADAPRLAAFTDVGKLLVRADPPVVPTPKSAPSEVEKLAELERTIKADEKQVGDIEGKLIDPKSEYALAEKEFKELDQKKVAGHKAIEALAPTRRLPRPPRRNRNSRPWKRAG